MTRAEGELDDVALNSSDTFGAVRLPRSDLDLISFGKRKGCEGKSGVRVLHVAGSRIWGGEGESLDTRSALVQSLASM